MLVENNNVIRADCCYPCGVDRQLLIHFAENGNNWLIPQKETLLYCELIKRLLSHLIGSWCRELFYEPVIKLLTTI